MIITLKYVEENINYLKNMTLWNKIDSLNDRLCRCVRGFLCLCDEILVRVLKF